MIPLVGSLILAVVGPAIDAHHADAIDVFRCDFEAPTDANFDAWPDGWTRRRGKGFPLYVDVGIVDEASVSPTNRVLRIDLDGGAATVYSKPIRVSSHFNYILRGRLKTEQLKHDIAFISLTFYDAAKNPIGSTYYSPSVTDAPDWQDVRIDITTPDSQRVEQAVIAVHLRPQVSADLVGSASFDDLSLARLPRMTMGSQQQQNIFAAPDEVKVECAVSGVIKDMTTVKWKLFDVYGRQLADFDQTVAGTRIKTSPETTGGATADDKPLPPAYAGHTSWHPPIETYGFYRISAELAGGSDTMPKREVSVAVLRPFERAADGEFGWSLPGGEDPVRIEALPGFLAEMGIHWVKFPIWRSESDTAWPARFAKFYDRLAAQKIQLIALLDQPPDDVRPRFGGEGRLPIASVFLQPEQWPDAIEPVLQRQSLKVRWWQLGSDTDQSFIGLDRLADQIADIKAQMERYGQRVRIGFSWRWINELPEPNHQPWAFITQSIDPALTAGELTQYLSLAKEKQAAAPIWVSLRPLADDQYGLDVRVRDLIERMLAAKIGGAAKIFIPDPFDAHSGMMNPDGSPRELSVVWRTAATLLSGAEYIGSIRMPQGSQNHIFARDGRAVMVVWNDQPTREVLYLGESIEQIDPWGIAAASAVEGHRQVIDVGPTPSFITGVSESVARWRMAVHFDNDQLKSIFGRPQQTAYTFTNTFDKTVNGTVSVIGPKVWDIRPTSFNVRLTTGISHTKQLRVQLGPDSNSGPHPVRIDFEISADRNYRFSVYRTIQVGLEDIQIDVSTRLRPDGALIVIQQLINNTEERVNFNCMLFAPHRRRERQQVVGLARGKVTRTFVLANGEELIGKPLWVRVEEIGGERILNFNVEAQR